MIEPAEKMVIEQCQLPMMEDACRLSDLRDVFEILPSRKGFKKAIDKGLVLLNGRRAQTGNWVSGGEFLELLDPGNHRPVLEFPLEVLFEDDYLAVINKPAGITVSGNKHRTVENALPFNLQKSSQVDALGRPQPIHRLDFPTSGVLLVGKTQSAVMSLNQMFAEQKVEKRYLAIAIGDMPDRGEIDFPIDGKPAISVFEKEKTISSDRFGALNLVDLFPKTGRRHQLRKHLSALGNPILGDKEYSPQEMVLRGKGLFLHAFSLRFGHPVTGTSISATAPVPMKFKKLFPR